MKDLTEFSDLVLVLKHLVVVMQKLNFTNELIDKHMHKHVEN